MEGDAAVECTQVVLAGILVDRSDALHQIVDVSVRVGVEIRANELKVAIAAPLRVLRLAYD